MKILVTGCAGFIGFHLTNRLLASGHRVLGVDNLNDYYSPQLKIDRLQCIGIENISDKETIYYTRCKNFCFVKANIESPSLYSDILSSEKFDLICHLAAQAGVRYSIENPKQYISSNIEGFFNILEYCRHHPPTRFVFASSSSIYGKNEKIPYSENDITDNPVSLYAATKKSNELLAHSYSELYGINTVGLRFFTVYGPWGRPDMAPFLFTKAILEGKPINVFNGGNMLRDFTYIDDITEGIYRVLLNEPVATKVGKYHIYNNGGGIFAVPLRLVEKRFCNYFRAVDRLLRLYMEPENIEPLG